MNSVFREFNHCLEDITGVTLQQEEEIILKKFVSVRQTSTQYKNLTFVLKVE